MTARRIIVVGMGDDGMAGLGEQARAAIASADVLFGGARHFAHVEHLAQHTARRVDLGVDFAEALRLLDAPSEERRVVLASGDPMLFGIGATLSARLSADCIEVLPHVSAAQLAFARLGEPMRDVEVLSAHGRELAPVLARAMATWRVAILLDDEHNAGTVARALLDAGMEDASAAVCSHLGGAEERVTRSTLREIADNGAHPSLTLLVVLRDTLELAHYRRSAIPDHEFAHRAGMITKAEVRALSVAALQLRPTDVLWDVGAGSGSVAVEAALQLPGGRVFAVERDPVQAAFLCENRVRFRVPQLQLVAGEAPAALLDLPAPDAVFIGGSGSTLPAIIEACRAALRPGGRLVLNLVAMERIGATMEQLRDWAPDVTQVSIARGVALGGPATTATRLDALNPVWIIAATKPGGCS